MRAVTCPDDNVLAALAQGLLDVEQARAVDEHVSGCEACTELLVTLGQMYAEPESTGSEIRRGTRVGRYEVEGIVGRGGMGTVYVAHDATLDRRVAVKLLHGDFEADAEVTARFLREAEALARLSHPNVVKVFDAGRHEGRTFVAMELVEGHNLAEWIETRPPLTEVLRVYVDAGRGLAAAHAQGVIHRDVKPHNILLGDADRRARVTDFGLARLEAARSAVTEDDEKLTGAGQALGTPRYMAPEQAEAGDVDARADQFAFCVAMWTAVFGRPPAEGRPPARRVPQGVVRALERGLSRDPEDRFATMEELLDALAQPRRGRFVVAGVVAAGVVAVGAAVAFRGGAPSCRDRAAKAMHTWNDADREAVRAAFAQVDRAYARRAWTEVAGALDRRRAAWVDAWTASCQAHEAADQPDDAELDAQRACLARQHAAIAGVVDLLSQPDADTVSRAGRVVGRLATDEDCLDERAATGTSAEAEAIVRDVSRLRALIDAGRYDEADDDAAGLVERAEALEQPRIEVDARLAHAYLLRQTRRSKEAETAYREALLLAEREHLEDAAVQASTALVFVVGRALRRHGDGAKLLRQAEAAVQRSGKAPTDSLALQLARGALALSTGDYEDAQQAYARALRLAEERGDVAQRADALNNLGAVAAREGRYDDGALLFAQAVELQESELGSDHPDLADQLHNLGSMRRASGDHEGAATALGRALALRTAALGPEHELVAGTVHAIGNLHFARAEYVEAEVLLRRALQIYEAGPSSSAEERANVLEGLGAACAKQGREAQGREITQRALILRRETLGDDHPLVARTQNNLGWLLLDAGEVQEAIKVLEAARATFEAAFGPDYAELGPVLENLAKAYDKTGRPAEAARMRERKAKLKAPR